MKRKMDRDIPRIVIAQGREKVEKTEN